MSPRLPYEHRESRALGWEGDLDDDCVLHKDKWHAHVENMGDSWWAAVYHEDGFHINAADISLFWAGGKRKGGLSARLWAEWLIRSGAAEAMRAARVGDRVPA